MRNLGPFVNRLIQALGPGYTDYHKQPVRINRSVRITSHDFGGLVIRTVRITRPQCTLVRANQREFFETATACTKCKVKTRVATLLNAIVRLGRGEREMRDSM